jgi:hypothetical protein
MTKEGQMPNVRRAVWIVLPAIGALVSAGPLLKAQEPTAFVATRSLAAPEANQAAAADERFVYAIDNRRIAQYDRLTGERVALSSGEALHLNSGYLWEGKLYCAHSNYPLTPAQSEILVLDPGSMKLTSFKQFGASRGSLTWCVRHADHWWCNFAHYGDTNSKTVLVKLDDQWREHGAWTYPPEVIADLGRYSISGGLWRGEELLVTGHDKRVVYRLRLPSTGSVLKWIETHPAPFPGQGIAIDPVTGGLVGIDRARKRVVLAQ